MAPNPRRQDAALDALYAKLPAIECQAMCADSCGPIASSLREKQRVETAIGKPLSCGTMTMCSALDDQPRCSAYRVRPMICRLWGLSKLMRCPYGCVPERWMDVKETAWFVAEADRIGGVTRGRNDALARAIADHKNLLAAAELLAKSVTPPTLEGRKSGISKMPKRVIDL